MPAITSGEKICAVAVTEAGPGLVAAGMRTRAVRDRNGWVMNGTKMLITIGVNGDIIFVLAKTDHEDKVCLRVTF